ncbi:MAG: hypothetical protein GX579_16450 [Chloroflexi bacterium]|jgi:hypothetical protein|nr:hypothetical protein [Chloroflexota bacterium]
MTRLWPQGTPITVACDDAGEPQRFVWQGERHSVAAVVGRWRLDMEWWVAPVRRDYYKLSTEGGLLVEIYHDLAGGQWYLQRLYD